MISLSNGLVGVVPYNEISDTIHSMAREAAENEKEVANFSPCCSRKSYLTVLTML